MLLTRIGTVIAHLMFWGGLFSFAVALTAAIDPSMMTDAGGQPYFPNPGKSIDLNLKYRFFGLLLGVVCEISSRVNKTGEQTSR
jgi:hypothetical protein